MLRRRHAPEGPSGSFAYHRRVPNSEPAVLSDRVRTFLEEPHFASLATVGPDGAPNQAVIWYRLEADGRILVNSREGRRWPANLRRDARANIAVFLGRDPNRWVGITGVVDEVVEDVERARDDIVALAARYEDGSPATIARFRREPRVSFLIRIARYHDHLEDD
jgi:PPOX class probable F420-dependent enzyme